MTFFCIEYFQQVKEALSCFSGLLEVTFPAASPLVKLFYAFIQLRKDSGWLRILTWIITFQDI